MGPVDIGAVAACKLMSRRASSASNSSSATSMTGTSFQLHVGDTSMRVSASCGTRALQAATALSSVKLMRSSKCCCKSNSSLSISVRRLCPLAAGFAPTLALSGVGGRHPALLRALLPELPEEARDAGPA